MFRNNKEVIETMEEEVFWLREDLVRKTAKIRDLESKLEDYRKHAGKMSGKITELHKVRIDLQNELADLKEADNYTAQELVRKTQRIRELESKLFVEKAKTGGRKPAKEFVEEFKEVEELKKKLEGANAELQMRRTQHEISSARASALHDVIVDALGG